MQLLAFLTTLFFGNAIANRNAYNVYRTTNCITFTVAQGTGCAWMCDFCANQLRTDSFYFTDGVCVYKPNEGGCVGSPFAGVSYTCCAT